MFEPDGRNSIQTMGHWAVTIIRYLMMVFAAFAVAPTVLFFVVRGSLRVQKESIYLINTDVRATGLLVDFNTASLNYKDLFDYNEFVVRERSEKHTPGLNPAHESLPFTVTYLRNVGAPGAPFRWEPFSKPLGNTWIYYNMPFEMASVFDKNFEAAEKVAGLWDRTIKTDFTTTSGYKRRWEGVLECGDPWYHQGLYKMAPTKEWDWATGFHLTHAKASYNYRAYVSAARAVSRMRYLVAMRKIGEPVHLDSEHLRGDTLLPARLFAEVPAHLRAPFIDAYRHAFQGTLPKVILTIQPLDDSVLRKDKDFVQWLGGEGQYQKLVGFWRPQSAGPFVTGIQTFTGYHPYDRWSNQITFAYGDYFYRTTPYAPEAAQDAQEALTKLLSPKFWTPRLEALGLGDDETLRLASTLLDTATKLTARDYRARRNSHKVYKTF